MKKAIFTLYPAIDLHQGYVVRLQQGKRDLETLFPVNPQEAAQKWINEGAQWLHVVNLDGAFGEDSSANLTALRSILSVSNGAAEVQYGGGLKNLASIDCILSMGVSRVILGSAAAAQPEFFIKALNTFGASKIVLGLDTKDNRVCIAGWEKKTTLSPIAMVQQFIPEGLQTVIHTNIRRDGMQTGVDIQSTSSIADRTRLEIIASGGTASINDVLAVKAAGIPGLVIGKALYEEQFTLKEALQC